MLKFLSLTFALLSTNFAHAKCLSHTQIMNEIRGFVHSHGAQYDITEATPVSAIATMLPAAWEEIDDLPRFRSCGLALGPNDLRYVTNAGELAGVIMWNINLQEGLTIASRHRCIPRNPHDCGHKRRTFAEAEAR